MYRFKAHIIYLVNTTHISYVKIGNEMIKGSSYNSLSKYQIKQIYHTS